LQRKGFSSSDFSMQCQFDVCRCTTVSQSLVPATSLPIFIEFDRIGTDILRFGIGLKLENFQHH